jgi:hypothetical protein
MLLITLVLIKLLVLQNSLRYKLIYLKISALFYFGTQFHHKMQLFLILEVPFLIWKLLLNLLLKAFTAASLYFSALF